MNISTSIYAELSNALLSNSKYASADKDPKLLRNTVIEDAIKMDKELIQILLDNPKLKSKFFTEINGVLVFDKIEFNYVINNKEFLPDSYTRFKQKIGLIDSHGEFISEKNDVVLSFPYKDCVLEGGQTKEDQDRDEIFYNQTLAPDEVDCLLSPKVFTNAKRYTKDGCSTEIEFRDDDNLLIKGNNLLVLSCLLKRYEGKVKLIYIDPPYNTGGDSFKYNDSFNHSTWLTFMKNRLDIARKLLRADGVLFVQCDDNEMPYLKVLLDSIFERDNFIQLVEIKANVGAANEYQNPFMPKNCEYGLMYAKNYSQRKYKPTWIGQEKPDSAYNKIVVNFEEKDYNKWEVRPLKKEYEEYIKAHPGYDYTKFVIDNSERIFQTISPKRAGKGLSDAMERSKINDGWDIYKREELDDILCYKGRMVRFYSKNILVQHGKKIIAKELGSLWDDIPWQGIAPEGGVKLKKGKKPERLIQRIIDQNTDEGDIVLDFFVGSGTTAAVAHKINRKYIGIEQLDYIESLTKQRMLNVLNGDTTGISKEVKWQGGGSFVYCELKELNQQFIRTITDTNTTSDELNFLYGTIINSSFISIKVDPKDLFSDEVSGDFSQLDDLQKKEVLFKLLDLNMLYVNYSDLNDADYNISEEDKKFSRSFYGDEE